MKAHFVIVMVFVLAIIVAACGQTTPSAASIETAIAQTQVAMPTFTLVPLSEMNLEEILLEDGDLPIGFAGTQIGYTTTDITKHVPSADYFVKQEFSYNNSMGGGVEVLLYEDMGKTTNAYQSILDNMIMSNAEDAGIGEKSVASSYAELAILNIEIADLAFIHCHAVVHIQFIGSANKDDIVAYGQRLDRRLQPLVCRP